MRVLITGGAGFLGSHLCERFLNEGYSVIAMDNLLTGDEKNIAHLKDNERFAFINQNVSESVALPSELDGDLDAVMHFASPASPPHYLKYPIETLRVGSYGTENALKLAQEKGAAFMIASTSEIYGDPLEHPQKEDYLGNVDAIGPRGVYDEAKRYGEAITMAYHRYHGVDTRILRIFNTYGPRMSLEDGRVVPNFIAQGLRGEPLTVYGDGQQTRSFQYVDDLVEGIYRLLKSGYHDPVNIGNPQEMTILEFAQVVNELTDNPGGIVFKEQERIKGDPQTRRPDISRAKEVLGWEPRVNLADGLQRTIEYFSKVVEA